MGDGLLDELVGVVDVRQRLLQVDDVDAVALGHDEALHLGVPATGLVPEVDAALEELAHGDDGHAVFSLVSVLSVVRGRATARRSRGAREPGGRHTPHSWRLTHPAPPRSGGDCRGATRSGGPAEDARIYGPCDEHTGPPTIVRPDPGCGEIAATRHNDPHGALGGDDPGLRRPLASCCSCPAGSSCGPWARAGSRRWPSPPPSRSGSSPCFATVAQRRRRRAGACCPLVVVTLLAAARRLARRAPARPARRRARPRPAPARAAAPRRRRRRRDRASVLALVTILPAIGRPDELVDSPDAVYHLDRIRPFLETGNFSIVNPTFYPTASTPGSPRACCPGVGRRAAGHQRRDRRARRRRVADRLRGPRAPRARHLAPRDVCRGVRLRGLHRLPDDPPRLGRAVAQPHGDRPDPGSARPHAAGGPLAGASASGSGSRRPCPAWRSSSPTRSSRSSSSPSSGSSPPGCAPGLLQPPAVVDGRAGPRRSSSSSASPRLVAAPAVSARLASTQSYEWKDRVSVWTALVEVVGGRLQISDVLWGLAVLIALGIGWIVAARPRRPARRRHVGRLRRALRHGRLVDGVVDLARHRLLVQRQGAAGLARGRARRRPRRRGRARRCARCCAGCRGLGRRPVVVGARRGARHPAAHARARRRHPQPHAGRLLPAARPGEGHPLLRGAGLAAPARRPRPGRRRASSGARRTAPRSCGALFGTNTLYRSIPIPTTGDEIVIGTGFDDMAHRPDVCAAMARHDIRWAIDSTHVYWLDRPERSSG